MKLTIRLSGLFLFSRRPSTKQVVILAPQTGPDLPIPVEAHVAELRQIGGPARKRLEGFSLEIGNGRPPSARTGTLSNHLADLNDFTARKPRQSLLSPIPGDGLTSRIILSSGKQCGSIEGATFRVRRARRKLTTEVYWEMEVDGTSIDLRFVRLDGSGEESLTVSAEGDRMCLGIFYMPAHHAHGLHARTPPGTISPHFIALYSLYDDPEDVTLPIFEALDDDFVTDRPPDSCTWCPTTSARGGDPVTCVGGSGDE